MSLGQIARFSDRGLRTFMVGSPKEPHERGHMFSLAGKKALVVGIANEDSIAYGCAKAFREQGAELAITFQSAKAEP
jgi:hypothetical protein